VTDFATSAPESLLVFADDWDRHPSSCQHLIRQLLPRYPTLWVDTIGMRIPRLDWLTARRAAEKFWRWHPTAGHAGSECRNLTVANPMMWPWFGRAGDRWLNKKLLTHHLLRKLQTLPSMPVAITTLPIVADLIDQIPVKRWIYYCVDDFAQWPNLDHKTLRYMEEKLVERADVIIAASDELARRIAKLGRRAEVLTHGVDPEIWQSADAHPRLARLEPPLAVFWGTIDRRLDLEMLHRLGTQMTRGTIVLVGPLNSPDPALLPSPRTVHVPSMPLSELATVAQSAAVLIMPYKDLPVTRAMQPLKLKEYMATGKPAVVTDLPATHPWADCVDRVGTPEAFSRVVRDRFTSGLPEQQRTARNRLSNESWASKAAQFERWSISPRLCVPDDIETYPCGIYSPSRG
jgi:glycosyltransferase involved in cell wall biosynthesis